MTIWGLLERAVASLPEPFGRQDALRWFAERHPEIPEGSIGAHLQGATSNVPAKSRGTFWNRTPLVTRVGRGQYVRYQRAASYSGDDSQLLGAQLPAAHGVAAEAPIEHVRSVESSREDARDFDIALVGCGRAKRPSLTRAADLYLSPGFRKRRTIAEAAGHLVVHPVGRARPRRAGHGVAGCSSAVRDDGDRTYGCEGSGAGARTSRAAATDVEPVAATRPGGCWVGVCYLTTTVPTMPISSCSMQM